MNISSVNLNMVTNQASDKKICSNIDTTKADLDNNNLKEISDRTDFSIDYSKDTVTSVIDEIKTNFVDSLTSIHQNKSITDTAALYGDILKRINSSTDFNDIEKTQLSKILDSSFDNYAKDISNKISKDISEFVNKAYNVEKSYEEQGIYMGIDGQTMVNQKSLEKNIEAMLSASKIFYKNNPSGTEEQLKNYLDKKYSKTQSIDNLSYKDFISLQKAVDISNNMDSKGNVLDYDFYSSFSKQKQAMNNALDSLKKDGASKAVVGTFQKATAFNKNCISSIEAFGKLRYSYEKKMNEIFALMDSEEVKLKELKKKMKEMLEKYRKEMEKLKEDSNKLAMNSLKNKSKQIENLSKQHDFEMNNLSKEQTQIEDSIANLRKSFEDMAKEYKLFLKSPASAIKEYLAKEKSI